MIKTVLRGLRPMLIVDSVEAKILELGKRGNITPEEAWNIIRELPPENYKTFMYIMTMIVYTSRVEVNRMKVNALLLVFIMNFMRCG